MILDNVGDSRDFNKLWPPSPRGSILLTSQNQNWLLQESIRTRLGVQSFSTFEGAKMLKDVLKRHRRSISGAAAERVVEEVGGLPLAIQQLGSYITATSLDPLVLLERYKKIA